MNDQPVPTQPKPQQQPWYERPSAPLAPEEVDGYDRLMAPERLPRRGPLFGGR